MSDRASALPLLAMIAVVAAGHLSLFPRVADLDGFYHVGHALAYLEGSLLDTSLPWATQSIIGDIGGDLWWGFHVLLLPFAALGGVEGGLRSAAVALTLTLGLCVYWVLRRHGVRGAGWWAAVFLVAVPNIFYRHLMVRPHVLSLAASIVLVSMLVRGRWWQVALISGLIGWVHLNLFWMGPAIALAYAAVRVPATVAVGRDDPDTGVPIRVAIPAALLGATIGWALRPDPVAAAALLNVQLLELFALKGTDVPITFAGELTPIAVVDLVRMSWLFAAAWASAMILVAWRGLAAIRAEGAPDERDRRAQERTTLIAVCAVVSAVFLVLALTSARRAMEQWVAFGFLLLPLLWSATPRDVWRPVVRTGAVTLTAAYLAWGAWRHAINVDQVAFPSDSLRETAEFLERNSAPGDIVFHTHWDNFGPLFAHNRTNRYLGGMDPIFLFAHDPASYWEFFYLSAGATTEWTCDAYPCAQGTALDTHEALTGHFGARWVLVEPFRDPRLSLYLLNDPRYELALETAHEAVFEVVRVPEA